MADTLADLPKFADATREPGTDRSFFNVEQHRDLLIRKPINKAKSQNRPAGMAQRAETFTEDLLLLFL
jgi:hypothetical protein